MRRWPNAAFGGNYVRSVAKALTKDGLDWAADEVFSVEILGTLTLPPAPSPSSVADDTFIIECGAAGGSYYLWLDDHLVCEGGNETLAERTKRAGCSLTSR